jgi:hypothetical protein
MTVQRSRISTFGITALMLSLGLGIATASTGCHKKSPAEKFGDKMDDVGDNMEEAVD